MGNWSGYLFENSSGGDSSRPLAARLRPQTISEVVGHQEYLGPEGLIGAMVKTKSLSSLVLAGPPGIGKTTIARLVANECGQRFVPLLASSVGVKEIKDAAEAAARSFEIQGVKTTIFIDEIHRLTKLQSDALLSPTEEGIFTLIGATTENPWMQISPALLSRLLIIELAPLGSNEVYEVIRRALDLAKAELDENCFELLYNLSGGDARSILVTIEGALAIAKARSHGETVHLGAQDINLAKPKASKGLSSSDHFEMISAMIKSMRASKEDAALYWLARLLVGGEDPRFIARRLVIFASEDVGLADPNALPIAEAASLATERIGMPEIRINLAHAAAYLSLAPKSKASYNAINRALLIAEKTIGLAVPYNLRGTVTGIERSRGKEQDPSQLERYFPKGMAEVKLLKLDPPE